MLLSTWATVIRLSTAFSAPPSFSVTTSSHYGRLVYSSINDDGDDGIDSIRSMLEASWDSDTMGQVPSDSKIAARESWSSIQSASDQGVSIFFVDLLLPTFDVTQGSHLYDEVLCVEYCIGLAECFKEKSRILVRDQKTADTVKRILDRREEALLSSEGPELQTKDDQENWGEDDDETGISSDIAENESREGLPARDEGSQSTSSDVDIFRQQLLSSWETDDAKKAEIGETIASQSKTPPPMSQKKATVEKRYKLASLFGNSIVSDGADMMQDVVEALRRHALPDDDEKNLIILSAVSMDEMVAVRSLAAKYSGMKNVILVNCKLDPIPRELDGAETVYSILPLAARAKGVDSQAQSKEGEVPPKAVILRRYPGDWQVFVDAGRGFKLAKTAPSDLSNKRGPPMKWIQGAIQDFVRTHS